MNQILFYRSFSFHHMRFSSLRHTDNSLGIQTHYIAKMLRGTGEICTLSGQKLIVHPGDVFYLPIGLRYHSYWKPDKDGEVAWKSFSFESIPMEQECHFSMQILTPSDSALIYLEQLIADATVSPISVGSLYLFLGMLMPSMTREMRDSKELQLERATQYIASHPQFTVPALARHCGVSESGIYALFQARAGMSPIEMKHHLQIERACILLSTTDLSVEEISSRLGFHSAGYFRRIFKHQTEKTPSEFRKEKFNQNI